METENTAIDPMQSAQTSEYFAQEDDFFDSEIGDSIDGEEAEGAVQENSAAALEGGEELQRTPAQNEDFFTVRYNGQDVQLKKEELITAAQKGLNYDKISSRLAAAENSKEMKLVDQYAQANGMSRESFLNLMEQQINQAQIEQHVAAGVPEKAATRLHQLEMADRQRRMADAEKQTYLEFVREYPGIKEFPPEVIEMLKTGAKPLDAYRSWENRQLKMALAMQGKKNANLQSRVGSAMGEIEGEEADSFLSGFGSIFQ